MMKSNYFLTTIFFVIIGVTSCSNNKKEGPSPNENNNMAATNKPIGSRVYKLNCALCHGSDGKLGANGSKDLTLTTLSLEERIAQITKGKGAMAAYENILSKDEIQAVAEYTLTLKAQ